VLIGFDAMDAGIARQLAAEGRMPTLARLLSESAWSPVINPPGLVVGSTWPSFWSGLWPSSHGFYCFRQLEAHSDVVRPYTPNDLAVPSFWSALAEAGRRVCIVDVPLTPLTRPAEGIHVQDWGTHDRMLPFAAWPDALEREIRSGIGLYPLQGKCDDYAEKGEWDELYRTLEAGIEKKTALNLRLLERGPWDAFVSIYCESHCAGHQFWWGHDPTHPRYTAEAGDPLARVYALLDGALARMLERVSDDATVMVLLSHGIGSHHDADHLLREIVTRLDDAYGPASTLRVTTEKARRAVLRWRENLRLKLQPHGPGERRWVDASRRFIRVPNNEMFGGIRINLAGRERRGPVRPGRELEELVSWLTRELMALTEPGSGRPIVRRVLRASELYAGDKVDGLPDLFIDWDRSAPITAASSATIGTVRGEYTGVRSGDHRPTGLLLTRGRGVARGSLHPAMKMVDLAPTITARLGVTMSPVDGMPVSAEALERSGAS
jgi:predicted AlkP superfamily phosphohydrolase/phosphomutase